MLDPDVVKRIMSSFHNMKDHLNSMEKEYSHLVEKGESFFHDEIEATPANTTMN